ncbi:MAG: thrombospondin type 3 repeat-containing protein [Chloroflexota bacterium]|nr:thrombospondin type 3 repeat-containing protein [Chloroflexota bacterium]
MALFRFNQDSDLDGYSDRSELRLGTDPNDPASHPLPELIAGLHSIQAGDYVTATLSLLNTGLYDAYGVESVMISPNDSISVTNNTVGGSGRVRALHSVVVGSRIMPASYDAGTWQGTAQPFSAGYYSGVQDHVYAFTALDAGDVSTGTLRFQWDDGAGANGTLNFGDGYASPTPLDVGSYGVQVGMVSGEIQAGDAFTVAARTPRDTFQYAINQAPHTEPVVLVSYNDPQGNHRFVTPATLSHPTDDLMAHSGQMLENLGVEIVTQEPVTTTGAYTTTVVVNWPADVTLEDAHLFLEFVNITGTVAAEVPVTVTIEPGPTVAPVEWSTAVFSPTFAPDEDYIVMVFWTDWQGNIIDTAARPLSSFQADPKPAFAMDDADATWDFGAATQGTVLKRTFTFANTGFLDLLTYVSAPASSRHQRKKGVFHF